jgi:hypothetical protein
MTKLRGESDNGPKKALVNGSLAHEQLLVSRALGGKLNLSDIDVSAAA